MELCDEQKRDQHSYAGDSSKMFGNVHEIVCKRWGNELEAGELGSDEV